MKTKNMFLSILLLSFVFVGYTQQRGFRQISLSIDGQTTTLYSGSHALVIGVSDYTNGWPDLPGVQQDVQNVKHGIVVIVVTKVTQSAKRNPTPWAFTT